MEEEKVEKCVKPVDFRSQDIMRKTMSEERPKPASWSSPGFSGKQEPEVETGSEELSPRQSRLSGQEQEARNNHGPSRDQEVHLERDWLWDPG